MTLTLQPLPPHDYEDWRAGLIDRMAAHRVAAGSHDSDGARAAAEVVVRRLLPGDPPNPNARVWEVMNSVAPVGTVWLDLAEGGGPLLLDVNLRDPAVVPEVRTLVEDAVRAEGRRDLKAAVFRDDPSLVAFTDGAPWRPAATQMVLSLGRPPAPSNVELRPMTPDEFADYHRSDVESYAHERHRAGLGSLDEMREVARQTMAETLPEGVETPGQHLWVAQVEGRRVGILWISGDMPRSFVYNVVVDPAHRGLGHGRSIMNAAAAWCRDQGADELGLNVFGHNHTARALYDSLGYVVVEELVQRSL